MTDVSGSESYSCLRVFRRDPVKSRFNILISQMVTVYLHPFHTAPREIRMDFPITETSGPVSPFVTHSNVIPVYSQPSAAVISYCSLIWLGVYFGPITGNYIGPRHSLHV